MSTSPKVISTIIEDEVTFLTGLDIDFVSLVRHGANRTPFKILKEDKGGSTMKVQKVVTAVLIPKEIAEEKAKTHLEGYRTDEITEHDSYVCYTQVAQESIDAESAEVVILNKEDRIFGVVANLKSDESAKVDDPVDPKVVEKESLDYATLDSMYDELWAMADIVGGALRQSEIKPAARKTTVLTAIDNFRVFASVILENASKKDAVKAEDHPELLHHITLMKDRKADTVKKDVCVCPKCGTEAVRMEDCKSQTCPECGADMGTKDFSDQVKAEEKAELDKKALIDEIMKKVTDLIDEIVKTGATKGEVEEKITKTAADVKAATLVELKTIMDEKLRSIEEVQNKITKLTKSVEKLETTLRSVKTDVMDNLNEDPVVKQDDTFSGVIFGGSKE